MSLDLDLDLDLNSIFIAGGSDGIGLALVQYIWDKIWLSTKDVTEEEEEELSKRKKRRAGQQQQQGRKTMFVLGRDLEKKLVPWIQNNEKGLVLNEEETRVRNEILQKEESEVKVQSYSTVEDKFVLCCISWDIEVVIERTRISGTKHMLSDILRTIILQYVVNLDAFVNTIGTFHRGYVASQDLTLEHVVSHFDLNCVSNIALTTAILPLMNGFPNNNNSSNNCAASTTAQMLICLSSLVVSPRVSYALQTATKAAYKHFIDVLRCEQSSWLRVATILPSSLQTSIFEKAGDMRDISHYPKPEQLAKLMWQFLQLPRCFEIPEVLVNNRK